LILCAARGLGRRLFFGPVELSRKRVPAAFGDEAFCVADAPLFRQNKVALRNLKDNAVSQP